MAQIPWPLSNTPGLRPQDGAGRLINVYAEPRGEGQGAVWRRAPGARQFTTYVTEMTGTASVTFVGVNRQGALSATGTGTPSFVGSST